jgi:acetate kinase
MNVLSILQNRAILEFALYTSDDSGPHASGELKNWMNLDYDSIPERIASGLKRKSETLNKDLIPDIISLRVPYGGTVFKAPAILSKKVLEKLDSIKDFAPLHILPLMKLTEALEKHFSRPPIILVFETGFFTNLPEREYSYAIDPGSIKNIQFRKFGYHGILHESAVAFSLKKNNSNSRILSVCLDPIPEVCAIKDGVPVMVTSGATPLEGLPGETTCGDLDPLIVLSISESLGWGPEQINSMLSNESGMKGIAGVKTSFSEVFKSTDHKTVFAKEIFLYKTLQAFGAGIAAMGGVDIIVFSGKYCDSGKVIKDYMSEKLNLSEKPQQWEYLTRSLLRITADLGIAAYLKSCKGDSNSCHHE